MCLVWDLLVLCSVRISSSWRLVCVGVGGFDDAVEIRVRTAVCVCACVRACVSISAVWPRVDLVSSTRFVFGLPVPIGVRTLIDACSVCFRLVGRVCAALDPRGTLDGTDPGNPHVRANQSSDVFECDLIPPGAATRLLGTWRASVDDQEAEILRVNHTSGRALLMPPDPPGYYVKVGLVNVRCVLEDPETGAILVPEFYRIVNVSGGCVSLLPCPRGTITICIYE